MVKGSEREADISSVTSTELYLHSSPACLHSVHTDNFTFNFTSTFTGNDA